MSSQKNNKEKIDFGEDRLLELASSKIDNHEYVSALKMLHKNAELNGEDDRTFMMYGEIYDDLDMQEESISNWFRYLDCAEDPDLESCYEGIAVNYMKLGEDRFSAYYYDKLIELIEYMDADARADMINNFLGLNDSRRLKFAYPHDRADYTEEISRGVRYIREHNPEAAIESFEQVPRSNKQYLQARNYIAMAYILSDNYEKAEEECNHIFSIDKNNIHALTTLAAVRTEQKRPEEAVAIARRLVDMKTYNDEEVYKIATVCCENKMHVEAYNMFCSLENMIKIDRNVLFFKAVSAYNSGYYEISFSTFDRLLALYPDAVVARQRYQVARENAYGGEVKELEYFYRLPQEMREKNLAVLSIVFGMTSKEAPKLADGLGTLDVIKWCFDETDSSSENELHYVAAECAVKAGYDDYARMLMLNISISDDLKINMLRNLCERNERNQFGIVVCNIYRCIDLYHIDVGRAKRKCFVSAYALLVSRFAIIDERYSQKFAEDAEKVYAMLQEADSLGLCKDRDTLAAVIFTHSGITEKEMPVADVCRMFGADKKRHDKIMEILEKGGVI